MAVAKAEARPWAQPVDRFARRYPSFLSSVERTRARRKPRYNPPAPRTLLRAILRQPLHTVVFG